MLATYNVNGTGTLHFEPGFTLQDTYTNATAVYSTQANAAWNAESILYGYGYTDLDAIVGKVDNCTKGGLTFDVAMNANAAEINTRDLYAITDNGNNSQPTYEFRIKSVAGNTLTMVSTDSTQVGYQAVTLGDSYLNGKLWRVTSMTPFLILAASTAGDWANGNSTKTGLYTKVRPGSKAGTKMIEVYWNGGLVETFDNLSANPLSSDFYTTRINDISDYIVIQGAPLTDYGNSALTLSMAGTHAANTASPWDSAYYGTSYVPVGQPQPMPYGAINAGQIYTSVVTSVQTGGQFIGGENGDNATATDFVGVVGPDDTLTGIKCFEDKDNVAVNILAAPMNDISITVMQELRRVAKKINALALSDVPAHLNIWQAIDWHNGEGDYRSRGRIDDPNIAVFWNWFTLTSPFDGLEKLVPPSLAALRCMANVWEREKPWNAAAGVNRGQIPECTAVEFERISEEAKQAMYGNGNSINPIWKTNGQFLLWGDRTLQRAESKLTAIHSVNLVNWIVRGLGDLARQFVFDPNDNELLVHIKLAFTEFLDKIANERGLEQYLLEIDDKNNTAATRNQRAVIVDLSIVPVDVAERIYVNVTVRESGAELNSVS